MMNIEANFDAEYQAADPFGAEMHRAAVVRASFACCAAP